MANDDAELLEAATVMPIPVSKLHPGEIYVLNCPKARTQTKRMMRFCAVATGAEIAAKAREQGGRILTGRGEHWSATTQYAVFMDLSQGVVLRHADGSAEALPEVCNLTQCYIVQGDGLRDGENRSVYVERRLYREN